MNGRRGRLREQQVRFSEGIEAMVSADSIWKPTHKPLVKSGKRKFWQIARRYSHKAGSEINHKLVL